jgi:drug/metabolite transporter (DMT)-like permease
LPLAAAAATGVIVGASVVATRLAIDQVGPASLALLRYAIALLCLLPAFARVRRLSLRPGHAVAIGLLGIAQFGALIVLHNYGLQFIPAGRAALIFSLMPLLAMLLAAILGHEVFSLRRAGGVLLTILGVAIALGVEPLQNVTGEAWRGDLALFGSALCGAFCAVLYRPYLLVYPAAPLTAIATLAAVLVLVLPAMSEDVLTAAAAADQATWLAILFLGLGSALGYWMWLWSLARAGATRVTVFVALSPLTAAGLGALVLGEMPTLPLLTGTLCVGAGLWLVQRGPRVTRRAAP